MHTLALSLHPPFPIIRCCSCHPATIGPCLIVGLVDSPLLAAPFSALVMYHMWLMLGQSHCSRSSRPSCIASDRAPHLSARTCPARERGCLSGKIGRTDTNCFRSNARLRGTSSKPGSAKSPISPTGDAQLPLPSGSLSQASQSSTNLASKLPPLPASPSLSQSISMMGTAEEAFTAYHLPRPLPIWLNPTYAKHIVKGNFMTLSAKPKTVEEGEWIAHQGSLNPWWLPP